MSFALFHRSSAFARQGLDRRRHRRLVALAQADLVTALGLAGLPFLRHLVALLAWPAAGRFARVVARLDDDARDRGLAFAAAHALPRFAAGLDLINANALPGTGPLLVVANHPGLTDALALMTAISRDDLLILAAERPLLVELPAVSRHLVTIGDGRESRLNALKRACHHLRDGGAVLTFPGGGIEPDPALESEPLALARWSTSLELLARSVAGGLVVPALVSGVLGRQALAHPLARLRRHPADRRWLAALLQVAWPGLHDRPVRLAFGQPLVMPGRKGDPALVRRQVERQMVELLRAMGSM
ncbi:hypothetical protein SAMN07250955_10110 [Arboricoccus pini]|uniref:Phospholipid/glycerol acyltransferase domain-containing protein n=1 Tax=Arboricoccus pini TaxID=1963835 RepID=A0A212PVJ7_9PROT|nr:1-acyl-sn-glycerol-3-phosphate acyltransferase [Arboricoccus pini]SNB50976.1 hypothetical protein SAMN07250955_10110 [Arboricoccus pini]